jgi:hypothetical protein
VRNEGISAFQWRKFVRVPQTKDIVVRGAIRFIYVGIRSLNGEQVECWAVPGGQFVTRRRALALAAALAQELS